MQVWKTSGGPAEAVCLDLVHCVPTWCRQESADAIPTSFKVNLTGASDMKSWSFLKPFFPFRDVTDHSAPNAQLVITLKLIKALLKIIWVKGEVAVEFDNEIP